MTESKTTENSYSQTNLSDVDVTTFEFQLYTDGSGMDKGPGGAASILVSMKHHCMIQTRLAMDSTNVSRMEFTALNMGLRSLFDFLDLSNGTNMQLLNFKPLTVLWVSDREDLVRSVDTRRSGYKRKANADLWCQFEYFEKLFTITPVHSKRETNTWHTMMDVQSSQCRKLIKTYVEEQIEL